MNKKFIFEKLNQCGAILADTSKLILFTIKDIRLFRHLRKVGLSISLGVRQRNSLNNSKDDGIFYFPSYLTSTPISGVVVINTLKGPFPDEGLISHRYLITGCNTNKQGGGTSYLKLSDTINDRLRSLKKSFSLSGGRGKLLFFRSSISFPLAGLIFNGLLPII